MSALSLFPPSGALPAEEVHGSSVATDLGLAALTTIRVPLGSSAAQGELREPLVQSVLDRLAVSEPTLDAQAVRDMLTLDETGVNSRVIAEKIGKPHRLVNRVLSVTNFCRAPRCP